MAPPNRVAQILAAGDSSSPPMGGLPANPVGPPFRYTGSKSSLQQSLSLISQTYFAKTGMESGS